MIRIFPRKTKWTPDDSNSFIGDPTLFRPKANWVRISVAFTWDKEEGLRLKDAWSQYYPIVEIGGPAFDDPGGDFRPGLFLKRGAVVTSRGCNNQCPWCFAWRREGKLRELPIAEGWNVMDNNLLQCSWGHFVEVIQMLRNQKQAAVFSGGLDARLLTEDHVSKLKSIRIKQMFFACDYPGAEERLKRASHLLGGFTLRQKQCYVLIGYKGETLQKAEDRLRKIFSLGYLPFAMLYRGEASENHDDKWKRLQRSWCRPAAILVAGEGK